jgi:hypothetical protein
MSVDQESRNPLIDDEVEQTEAHNPAKTDQRSHERTSASSTVLASTSLLCVHCERCGASEELDQGCCWECVGAAGLEAQAVKPLVMGFLLLFGHRRDLFTRLDPKDRTEDAYMTYRPCTVTDLQEFKDRPKETRGAR